MRNYFELSEQYCPCCKSGRFAPDFLAKLNQAREYSGVPYHITSGFRCDKHNKEVGGTYNSSHLVGCAADISAKDNYTRYKVLEGLFKVGFQRIGIGKDFIHVDDDFTKPQVVCWLYS